ncbi:hypothetical protein ACI2KL_17660 [Pseudomonas yamanorum]|uniref:hypothetical protein n=1 Tax=Pseudomonas yamanorum TaxID=515393 RepID=UPI00384A9BD5
MERQYQQSVSYQALWADLLLKQSKLVRGTPGFVAHNANPNRCQSADSLPQLCACHHRLEVNTGEQPVAAHYHSHSPHFAKAVTLPNGYQKI